jgi:hypothetical protein
MAAWYDELPASEREELRDAGRVIRHPSNSYDPCTGQFNRLTGEYIHEWERCPVHKGGK